MKAALRTYCNKGQDILTASDMRTALLERPVRGTTAAVCVISKSDKTAEVNKIDGFSKLHNFCYEDKGVCLAILWRWVWKANVI